MSNSLLHGGELVGEVLKSHNVKFLFTLCGGHISPILVGSKNHGIKVIDVRDEVNAVFAADAVSRLTGIPGVAAVTAGPGLTNTITAVKNAQLAETPVIILGGATATVLKGRGSLQDINQMSLMKPHVKWASSVKRVKDIVPVIVKAFEKSQSGVPGPVFIELPIDLLYPEQLVRDSYGISNGVPPKSFFAKVSKWYLTRRANKIFAGGFDLTKMPNQPVQAIEASDKQISKVATYIKNSKKPVMLIGSQSTLNPSEITELQKSVEKLKMPTFLSGMARGLLGKNHPLHIRHKRRNALKEADLVILAGVAQDFRLDYGRHMNGHSIVISINRNKSTLRQNQLIKRTKLKIHADPGLFLHKLASNFQLQNGVWKGWQKTLLQRHDARNNEIITMGEKRTDYINPLQFCQEIEGVLDDNSLIIGDGGDWISTFSYIVQPRSPLRWLDPGVFGTLGAGAGFALGAKLTHPQTEIWLIYGDGSVGYSLAEFDTFVRHNIPIIAVVGNDASWTQIAREQVPFFNDDIGTTLSYTDYHKVVEGFGAVGIQVKHIDDVPDALKKAKALAKSGKPVLINALIGKTEFRKGSLSM
ncbi:MAG: thiamine pyrophosphate-binding protein [Candidatus Kariarchaeaceae archaeon]|jgi:thiamine pyrophosphate-dependent acetolactate synthase large subunit-like protein